MEKKMTRKMAYEALLNMEEVKANPEIVAILERQLELVSREKSAGKTANQKANDELVEKIFNFMNKDADKEYVIADIMNEFDLSNQKATALLKKLVDAKKVDRNKNGKKTSYVVAD